MASTRRTTISNRELVEELKQGSKQAYRKLAHGYRKRLIREATSAYSLPHADAEELANDVLMAVANRIGQFTFRESDHDFRSWVLTIFRNRIRDHVRKQSATRHLRDRLTEQDLPVDRSLMQAMENESVVSRSRGTKGKDIHPDVDPETGCTVKEFSEVLETMKPWEQTLLKCRAMGIPYGEIAGYTGKEARVLKVYHARVLARLRKRLAQRFPDLGFASDENNSR